VLVDVGVGVGTETGGGVSLINVVHGVQVASI